ncbi:transmembrane protein 184C isoform X2 [Lycorma delicatula]|uniref:transmembrane protein 184C isoform X2 n=1 Tax=Lycorma delicatula TaxID=130591 RepID=UPI003F51873B
MVFILSYVLRKWRIWLRPVVMLCYLIFVIVYVVPFIKKSLKDGFKKKDPTPLIGGTFVVLAIPISIWEIMQHMIHHSRPYLQKHIIRILWMVPIYAVNAWLGLTDPSVGIYVDCARECYEAYVIYNFMIYLLNFLNYEKVGGHERSSSIKSKEHQELVLECKHGILQYTVVRPITTGIAFICHIKGVYGDGQFKRDVAYPYIILVNNISQFVAMFYLARFYTANKVELAPMHPIGKFFCIKAVIFFSFLQQVIIAFLVHTNLLSSVFDADNDDAIQNISYKLQNFLLCIEMFLAAIAHHYSFSHRPFTTDLAEDKSLCDAFIAMLDFSDIGADLKEHFGFYELFDRNLLILTD